MGWRLLTGEGGLWAEVIKSKYKIGELNNTAWTMVKPAWSSTWKSIAAGLRDVILPNLSWVLGDGHKIRFWADRWLTEKPLCEYGSVNIPATLLSISVSNLWRVNDGWDMQQITPYVSEEIRLQLLSRVVSPGLSDRISWGDNSNGKFTVASAYLRLSGEAPAQQQMGQFYARIWQVVAPERDRLFLWLVSHQAIMTNMERLRRHLSNTGVCQICRGGYETILHVLRDCGAMEGIWMRLVPRAKHHAFFEMSLLEWLYVNLGDTTEVDGGPWASIFAIAVWWGWKWRCGNVFNSVGKCRDKVGFLRTTTNICVAANGRLNMGISQGSREERLISWTFPSAGWFKVNTDGASHGNPGLATAGGVVHDEMGAWCGGFALNIEICSAPLAELWGVYYGLCIAWERGINQLELEVDSEIVVGFLKKGIDDSHPLSFLVRLCYGLLSKDWIVRVTHVYREANRLADGLANYAFSLPLGLHLLPAMPDSVSSVMLEDANGVMHPRMIRV